MTRLTIEQLLDVEIDKVYSASRRLQDVRLAPASVTVVTAADIRRFGYRTLADVLRSVTGFYTTYDRNYTYVGVRGFGRPGDYNTRVLVMIDGYRSNDGVYDEALVATEFPVDVALIDRVEVVRGPSSSLYGNSAFLGVVNVITKRGHDLAGTEAQVDLGTLGTTRGRISGGAKTRSGVEWVGSATASRSSGEGSLFFPEFALDTSTGGVASDMDRERYGSAFGRVSYRGFSFESAAVTRQKMVPTASWDTVFGDRRFETTDSRFFATMQYGHSFDETTELVGRVFLDQMQYEGGYPMDMGDGSVDVEHDSASFGGLGGELLVSRRLFGRNSTTAGLEARDNFRLEQAYSYSHHPDLRWFSNEPERSWAVFGQQELRVARDVMLNAGIRYDHNGSYGGSINPRLAVILFPSRPATVKLLYGTAFRAPSAYELHYFPDQPDLRPETIRTSEAVWEQRIGADVRASVSAFYNVIDDLISERANTPADVFFANADRATAKGTEWQIEGRWRRGVIAGVGHSWVVAQDRSTGADLSNAPRHSTKLHLAFPVWRDRLVAAFEGEHTGERLTIRGERVDGFFRQNAAITAARMGPNLDLRFTIGTCSIAATAIREARNIARRSSSRMGARCS